MKLTTAGLGLKHCVLLGIVLLAQEVFAFRPAAVPSSAFAPAADTLRRDTLAADSIEAHNRINIAAQALPIDTAAFMALTDSLSAAPFRQKKTRSLFRPNPKRALWLALVLPGAGQIYNRKYWKLPIIYGGFLGCTYALMWNQQMYKDYSQAYLDLMDDDPNTKSYEDILPPRYKIDGNEERFQRIFKNKKDYYRRYRDLSAFAFIGVYIISVIDAYVDAQLSEFDISRDLSLQIEPAAIKNRMYNRNSQALGLQCNFKIKSR